MQDDGDDIDTGTSEPAAPIADSRKAATAQATAESRKAKAHERMLLEGHDEPQEWSPQSAEPSGTVKRRRARVYSPEYQEAFKKNAEAIKKQIDEDGATADPMDDYDLGEAEPPRRIAGDAKPKAEAQTPAERSASIADAVTGGKPAATTAAAPAEPPAPSLDPGVLDHKRRLDEREQQLLAREREIEERAAGTDVQRLHDSYGEDSVKTIVDFVKRSLGLDKDEDVKSELADLVSALSGEVLGVDIPPEIRAKMEQKRTIRIVKNHEKRLSERERLLAEKQAQQSKVETRGKVVSQLDGYVRGDAGKAEYPWLAREGNAGDIVMDIVETQLIKDAIAVDPSIAQKSTKAQRLAAAEALHDQGRVQLIRWEIAAKQGNDYLKRQWNDEIAKRKDLFDTGPKPTTDAKPAAQSVQQGDPAGIRGSRTLSNTVASQTPAAPAPKPRSEPSVEDGDANRSRHWNKDRWRANTRRQLREAFRQSEDDQA